jgi:hypothetical protein
VPSSTYAYRGLYLLHFEPRYRHAGHYLGYAKRDTAGYARRVARGAALPPHPLVECAVASCEEVRVAAIFHGADRADRRRMRARGSLARICPICRESGSSP